MYVLHSKVVHAAKRYNKCWRVGISSTGFFFQGLETQLKVDQQNEELIDPLDKKFTNIVGQNF